MRIAAMPCQVVPDSLSVPSSWTRRTTSRVNASASPERDRQIGRPPQQRGVSSVIRAEAKRRERAERLGNDDRVVTRLEAEVR